MPSWTAISSSLKLGARREWRATFKALTGISRTPLIFRIRPYPQIRLFPFELCPVGNRPPCAGILEIGNSNAAVPMTGSPSEIDRDLDAEADEALEMARSMPRGPEKVEALKKAGLLGRAVDARRIAFAKRGRPPKTP